MNKVAGLLRFAYLVNDGILTKATVFFTGEMPETESGELFACERLDQSGHLEVMVKTLEIESKLPSTHSETFPGLRLRAVTPFVSQM